MLEQTGHDINWYSSLYLGRIDSLMTDHGAYRCVVYITSLLLVHQTIETVQFLLSSYFEDWFC
jgi:hypothetical protein